MHPSFGVPWTRLQRAAARLEQLDAPQPDRGRVHAFLFLCGLRYLLTYRAETGRRLSHYLDDGLREAVENTLPVLMRRAAAQPERKTQSRIPASGGQFEQLRFGFRALLKRLPAETERWASLQTREANLVRLSFGMGVVARFAPDSHQFIRALLEAQPEFSPNVSDVLNSFNWSPDWSVALAR